MYTTVHLLSSVKLSSTSGCQTSVRYNGRVKYQGISIRRIAVGVQSHDNAPAEYWSPGEDESELPDTKELAEMLAYAEMKLRGHPTTITIAVIYEAPNVVGEQLNRRTSYRPDKRQSLDSLLRDVLSDCVEAAERARLKGDAANS